MAGKGWCNDFEPHLERSNGVPRGSLTRLPVAERSLTAVTEQVLTPEEAQKEAARCMACGRAFEANRTCWFCLPCEIDCPEEALTVRMPYLCVKTRFPGGPVRHRTGPLCVPACARMPATAFLPRQAACWTCL